MAEVNYYQKILESAEDFHKKLIENNTRRSQWVIVFPQIVEALKTIEAGLRSNPYFTGNIYVIEPEELRYDSLVYIKSGNQSLGDGEAESGFQVHFAPSYNGRLKCYTFGFETGDTKNSKSINIGTLEIQDVNIDSIMELFYKALEEVKPTSKEFLD